MYDDPARNNSIGSILRHLRGIQYTVPWRSDRNILGVQLIIFGYIMPVRLDDHDPELDLRPGTTKSDIVAFLYRNAEFGYSPQDIKELLDIPRGTATTTLKRLYDDDYIGKTEDGYYYARSEREDIHRYVSSLTQVARMFGHHRDGDATPEAPEKRIGEDRTAEDLDAELAELGDDSGDSNE